MQKEIHFSRLLKVFPFKRESCTIFEKGQGFIIELVEDGVKKLYLSAPEKYSKFGRIVKEQKDCTVEELSYFGNLSQTCLMKDCENADNMFAGFPITHFENVDCSKLKSAKKMFYASNLKGIKADFAELENAFGMFKETPLLKIDIDFPKLQDASHMFDRSELKSVSGNYDNVVDSFAMFYDTKIKEGSINFPKLERSLLMYDSKD